MGTRDTVYWLVYYSFKADVLSIMGAKQATTPERKAKQAIVIAGFGEKPPMTVGLAARKVGVSRSCLYEWKSKDEKFSDAWDEAVELTTDRLEALSIDHAINGYTESRSVTERDGDGNVTSTREEVTHKRDLTGERFLLGARRRGVYGAKTEIEHKGEITTKRVIWGDAPEPTDPQEPLEEE